MFHPEGPTFRELMIQALSSTERGYDLIAPTFDHTPFRTPDPVVRAVVERIGPVRSAIDLCCGTGVGVRGLRTIVTERVVGMDRSAGMLEEARRSIVGPGPAVELVRGDVLEHPFHHEFDAVTCHGAFGHVEHHDQPRLAAQIRSALVPGGRFVFMTRDRVPRISRQWVLLKGFNAVMRVRNALISPPFVMYYLNFLLPRAREVLEAEGFRIRVSPSGLPGVWSAFLLVEATAP